MRLELRGHHVDVTPALKRLVESKLTKLERLLNASALSAQTILTLEKHRHRADITLHARGEKFLHGVGTNTNWEAALNAAMEKIEQQAQKVKTRWKSRKQRVKGAHIAAPEVPPETAPADRLATAARRLQVRMPRILKATRQAIKPMSVADAAREVEAGNGGLVIFRDLDRDSISVLYRQGNGELTLVETEA
jgi:putative sigma-54 modulation protein